MPRQKKRRRERGEGREKGNEGRSLQWHIVQANRRWLGERELKGEWGMEEGEGEGIAMEWKERERGEGIHSIHAKEGLYTSNPFPPVYSVYNTVQTIFFSFRFFSVEENAKRKDGLASCE